MVWLAGKAYRRRWARLAWHVGALTRADLTEWPLEKLTGERPPAPREQAPEDLLAALRMHKALRGLKPTTEGTIE